MVAGKSNWEKMGFADAYVNLELTPEIAQEFFEWHFDR